MIGAYKVHAEVDQDSNNYYRWYMSVYDLGRHVGDLKTLSSHYYWVQSLTNSDVYGRWEFAHRIREGWVLGEGDEALNISTHGNIPTLNDAYDGTSDSDTRRGSYAGFIGGLYHIEAYTNLSLNVIGVQNSDIHPKPSQVTEYHTFELEGDEGPN